MGKPQEFESEQDEKFQIFRQNGGKPILVSSVSTDGNSDDESVVHAKLRSFEDEHNVEHVHDNDDKVNCDCNKEKPKITYGPESVVKGKPETYIHHQPKIIVRQPPTHVRIEHPPTIIQPSTIVLHRTGKTIKRPVIYQHLPRDVRVRPVIVKVVRPIEKKVLVDRKDARIQAPCEKHTQQHKIKLNDDHNLEYETKSYGGESYGEESYSGESYGGESYRASYEEHEHEHEHEHESFRAHVNVKETSQF